MGTIETELVEDGDVVGDPCGQRVRLRLVRRTRTPVPSVIGEDQPELVAERHRHT